MHWFEPWVQCHKNELCWIIMLVNVSVSFIGFMFGILLTLSRRFHERNTSSKVLCHRILLFCCPLLLAWNVPNGSPHVLVLVSNLIVDTISISLSVVLLLLVAKYTERIYHIGTKDHISYPYKRWVHGTTLCLFLVCFVTDGIMYKMNKYWLRAIYNIVSSIFWLWFLFVVSILVRRTIKEINKTIQVWLPKQNHDGAQNALLALKGAKRRLLRSYFLLLCPVSVIGIGGQAWVAYHALSDKKREFFEPITVPITYSDAIPSGLQYLALLCFLWYGWTGIHCSRKFAFKEVTVNFSSSSPRPLLRNVRSIQRHPF